MIEILNQLEEACMEEAVYEIGDVEEENFFFHPSEFFGWSNN